MKKYFVSGIGLAIIALITGTTAFAQVLENINPIQRPIVSSNTKQTLEIKPDMKPVINSVPKQMVDLSKELTLKPVFISEVKLVLDPSKVMAETPKPLKETYKNEDETYSRLIGR